MAGYKCKDRWSATQIGSENLTKPDVQAYLDLELDRAGYNDRVVDSEHLYVIKQREELTPKMAGIREYNKVRGRHAPQKHDVNESGEMVVKVIDYSNAEVD